MRPYEVILHERAWEALATSKGAIRERLLASLDRVKAGPFRTGDFQQRDANGRINEVFLQDDWLVTFWSDHAACEIHVVNLEQVED
ncbi:MAG: hypothetical protein JNL39_10200 [Opitutaceae bacterium]|nr:hypothetical protein [Opitutaceae bacterium]